MDDFWKILKRAAKKWQKDRATQKGAALAYYAIFAIAPFILIAISIGGLLFQDLEVRKGVIDSVADTVGPQAAQVIEATIINVQQTTNNSFFLGLGIIIILVTASGIFVEIKNDLNEIFNYASTKSGIKNFAKERIKAFFIMLLVSLFVLLSLASTIIISAASKLFSDFLPLNQILFSSIDVVANLVILTFLFSSLYSSLSNVQIPFRKTLLGGFVAATLFTIGKVIIGFYLGRSNIVSAYGAAGSLVILLMWIYYSSQIFFYGSEVVAIQNKK